MHFRTHTKPESIGQSGRWQSPYHDTMIDHDKNVGTVLKVLDDLGIADNTFVMYSTDNGPRINSWPDGAMTPFRNEKNSNWEGAYRVPAMVRWPGKIKPGEVSNERRRAAIRSIAVVAAQGLAIKAVHRPSAASSRW
jgi:arylsulfatase A-like enzyme